MARRAKLDLTTEQRLADLIEFSEELPEAVERLLEMEKRLMGTISELTEAVKRNNEVTKGAVVLINGLASRIAECGTNPAQLDQLIQDLRRNATELGDAVAANTSTPPSGAGPAGTVANPGDSGGSVVSQPGPSEIPSTPVDPTTGEPAGPAPGTNEQGQPVDAGGNVIPTPDNPQDNDGNFSQPSDVAPGVDPLTGEPLR